MVCLGLGNGAVFQLVPQCFRRQIGIATGVVGAIGGLGGFMLPTMLGQFKQRTGSFGAGFVVLGTVALPDPRAAPRADGDERGLADVVAHRPGRRRAGEEEGRGVEWLCRGLRGLVV